MQTLHDVPLSTLTTMQLGGLARQVTTVTTKDELITAVDYAQKNNLPILVLGDGSNMVVRDSGFNGMVILNRIKGFNVHGQTVTAGAGEPWDSVVERTVKLGLSGIEALSAIPGTAGATPVQNVGAYGQDISQTLTQLEAYDMQAKKFVTLSNADCQFGYRTSQFKSLANRRYIIVSITLQLRADAPKPPFYASLQKYFDQHKITTFTAQTVRNAVIDLRAFLLPDPKIVANSGSFFKNPIVTAEDAENLLAKFPTAPHWPMPDGQVKLAAGWLVDQAGLKDYQAHGMATYKNNALVFVNHSAKKYADLAAFQAEVTGKVKEKFGIILEQEPELI